MKKIYIKRIYDSYEDSDGYRILVDRLWPRGISKADAKLDEWAKDFTPSSQLRKQIHQEEISWDEFALEYVNELNANPGFKQWIGLIKDILQLRNVTLITAAKFLPHNHADTLKEIMERSLKN